MAKKIDYSKLDLGSKKPVKKVEKPVDPDEAVAKIHTETPAAPVIEEKVEKAQPVREESRGVVQPAVRSQAKSVKPAETAAEEMEERKRITIDLPSSLHMELRIKNLREGMTLREYVIRLIKQDMGLM